MVKTNQKGYRSETIIRTAYKNNEYHTYRSPNVRNGDNDIFNLWDLIVAKKYKLKLIQVKSNMSDIYKFKNDEDNLKWLIDNPLLNIDFELFCVLPKRMGGIRKWKWLPNLTKWEEVLDFNKFYD